MIAARVPLRWRILPTVGLLVVASCGSSEDQINSVARAELERRYSEATSEKERRLLGIQLVEHEISDADLRTGASRGKLRESLAKEQVVSLQLAEHLTRIQNMEQDLAAAQRRLAMADAERQTLEAQERRLLEVRSRKGSIDSELAKLSAEVERDEARNFAARTAAQAEMKRLEAEITRLAQAGQIVLAALAATQELTARPASRPLPESAQSQSQPSVGGVPTGAQTGTQSRPASAGKP